MSQVPLRRFLGQLRAGALPDGHYLHDWPLPLHAPALCQRLRIPKYFAGDILKVRV
jgi:hypothetical protein